MDEDPKCIKVIKIPSLDSKGVPVHYDRLAVSPDNQILAVTHGTTLQWLRFETGEILDTAENAHDGASCLLAIILLDHTDMWKRISNICFLSLLSPCAELRCTFQHLKHTTDISFASALASIVENL